MLLTHGPPLWGSPRGHLGPGRAVPRFLRVIIDRKGSIMWIGWKAVSLGVVSGGAIAVGLYSTLAPGSVPVSASIPVSQAVPTVVYADCIAPAVLEDGDCVTHVTVTRTVPAPPAQPAVTPVPVASTTASRTAATPKPTPVAAVTEDDDDHESDHDYAHGDDDDHDDDHGDDDGED